ncbi:hypothetical protein LZ480_07750 [Solibacillus sp. MA9]|uniref:Lipoprotein n=1 Tax=Solibacillus palustris TaxID=2908203 RepID=A0ABS9UBR2_9BACL|nr:hypothetical protein [Solibacillus sp. MA9]MCH7321786.1 hypothetical protein [Solibacillus sp. MA9]
MKLKIIAVVFFLFTLVACSSENTSKSKTVEQVIDVTQFNKISSSELVKIMGEPEQIEDFEWTVPKNNQSIVGKLYIYEGNKYEFILFDDILVRANIYSGDYIGHDNTIMSFEEKEDIFPMFGISPNSSMRKEADTNYALRYERVSDDVEGVWILEIENKNFGIAKFTYDSNYF